MKSIILIFALLAGAMKAELPAGATDLVPHNISPASEKLKINKSESKTTVTMTVTPSLQNYMPTASVEIIDSSEAFTSEIKTVPADVSLQAKK